MGYDVMLHCIHFSSDNRLNVGVSGLPGSGLMRVHRVKPCILGTVKNN